MYCMYMRYTFWWTSFRRLLALVQDIFEMATVCIDNALCKKLESRLKYKSSPLFSSLETNQESLNAILPAVRMVLLWMQAQPHLWSPHLLQPSLVYSGVPILGFWAAIADLMRAAALYVAGMGNVRCFFVRWGSWKPSTITRTVHAIFGATTIT